MTEKKSGMDGGAVLILLIWIAIIAAFIYGFTRKYEPKHTFPEAPQSEWVCEPSYDQWGNRYEDDCHQVR